MKKPYIALTTYGRNEDNRLTLPAQYVEAVRRAGGIPLLLPPGEPEPALWLDLCQGVIFVGGGDIDPAWYGGSAHETIYAVDVERDSSEIALMTALFDRTLPVLCICRGAQVLNVALGGTLIENVPDVVGPGETHRRLPHHPTSHPVRVEADSRLAEIMGRTDVSPVSWHHQAIRDVAPGLRVVAYADDGLIEAVELQAHPWFIGVQWHPELTAAEDVTQQRLFGALVGAATNLGHFDKSHPLKYNDG